MAAPGFRFEESADLEEKFSVFAIPPSVASPPERGPNHRPNLAPLKAGENTPPTSDDMEEGEEGQGPLEAPLETSPDVSPNDKSQSASYPLPPPSEPIPHLILVEASLLLRFAASYDNLVSDPDLKERLQSDTIDSLSSFTGAPKSRIRIEKISKGSLLVETVIEFQNSTLQQVRQTVDAVKADPKSVFTRSAFSNDGPFGLPDVEVKSISETNFNPPPPMAMSQAPPPPSHGIKAYWNQLKEHAKPAKAKEKDNDVGVIVGAVLACTVVTGMVVGGAIWWKRKNRNTTQYYEF
ncbi:hypothetical protein BSKO_04670 [Bryopsis sp. KO-2023]|nr:hypothetical protein BSKO_04670 [Bryopsis sp. KO-2023]